MDSLLVTLTRPLVLLALALTLPYHLSNNRVMMEQLEPRHQTETLMLLDHILGHSTTPCYIVRRILTASANDLILLGILILRHLPTQPLQLLLLKTLQFSKNLEQMHYFSSFTTLKGHISNTWLRESLRNRAGGIIKST